MTRLELINQHDVADIDYVVGDFHGWLVLKAAMSDRDETCVVFDSEFTIHQYSWLIRHHRPSVFLRSWLVVGRRRQSASINEWLMVPAHASVRFIKGCPTYSEVCRYEGARICLSPGKVIEALRDPTRG